MVSWNRYHEGLECRRHRRETLRNSTTDGPVSHDREASRSETVVRVSLSGLIFSYRPEKTNDRCRQNRDSPRMNSLTVERTRHMSNSFSARPWIVFTLLYLIFEFGRPQDKVGELSTIRLGLILISNLGRPAIFNWRRLRMVASSQTSCMLMMLFCSLSTSLSPQTSAELILQLKASS